MQKWLTLLKSPNLWVGLIVLIGCWARLYRPGNYPFGFDQIQILENSQAIIGGEVTLIGPRTGPAPMFTGPLIYYLNTLSLVVLNNPWSLVLTTSFISLLTGVTIWWLSKVYVPKLSPYLISVWAFSPLLITLDRVPWNPNLSLLAAALSFFPLMRVSKTAREKWQVAGLLLLGGFLGYQAHFSGLILPFLVIGTFLVQGRWAWLEMLASLTGLVMSLLPTLLFDLRHDWLNARGLIALFSKDDNVNLRFLIIEAWKTLQAMTYHLGSLVFHWSDRSLIWATGSFVIIISIIWWWRQRSSRSEALQTALVWLFGYLLAMSLYRQNKPEYYFLMSFPAAMVLVAIVLEKWLSSRWQKVAVSSLVVGYIFLSVYSKQQVITTLGIGNLQMAANTIHTLSQLHGLKKINYNMRPVDTDGLQYLTKSVTLNPSGKTLQVDYPQIGLSQQLYQYGQLSIWLDPRDNKEKNYMSTGSYILESPVGIELFESYYVGIPKEAGQTLTVMENKVAQGQLVLVVRRSDSQGFERTMKKYQAVKSGVWQQITDPREGFIFMDAEKIMLYYPQSSSVTKMPDWGNALNLL